VYWICVLGLFRIKRVNRWRLIPCDCPFISHTTAASGNIKHGPLLSTDQIRRLIRGHLKAVKPRVGAEEPAATRWLERITAAAAAAAGIDR
jgi:hypothetical protein